MTFLSTKTWAEKVAQTNTGEAARRLKTHTEETGIEAESPGAWWNTLRCQQPSALFTLNHFCGSHKITASIGCFCLMHPHKYFHHWKSFPAVESFRWLSVSSTSVSLPALPSLDLIHYPSWNSPKLLPFCTCSSAFRSKVDVSARTFHTSTTRAVITSANFSY